MPNASPAADELDEETAAKATHDACVEHAAELVASRLKLASEDLYERHLKREEVPFTASRVLREALDIVDWAFLPRDDGETAESVRDFWENPDPEPMPAKVDAWARGTIPSKKPKKRYDEVGSMQADESKANRAPSESGRSMRSRTKRSRASQSANDSKKDSVRKRGAGNSDIVVILEEEPGHGNNRGGGASRKLTPQEEARIKAMRELEAKEQAAEEVRRKRVEAERLEAERAERMAKELKGKDYTFDHQGNVIVINAVNADKLPPAVHNMQLNIRSIEEQLPDAAEDAKAEAVRAAKPKAERSTKGGSSSRKSGKKRNAKEDSSKFYRNAASFQQRVLKNPGLRVESGVSFREGGDSKVGPKREDDPSHMSRKEFLMHQTVLESQSISVVDAAGSSSSPDGLVIPTIVPLGDDYGAAAATPSTPAEKSARSALGSPMGGAMEPIAIPGGNADIDEAGGDEPRSPMVPLPSDPNLDMMKDPSWGQNPPQTEVYPAVLPKPPNPRQREETLGLRIVQTREPRDRPNVEKVLSQNRQHLPAPPYPAVQGHGGVLQSGASPSPLSTLDDLPSLVHSPSAGGPTGLLSHRDTSRTNASTSQMSQAGGSVATRQSRGRNEFPPAKPSRIEKVEIKSDRARRLLGL